MWRAIYGLIWPPLALVTFLFNDRVDFLTRTDISSLLLWLAIAYGLGLVPARLIGWLFESLGLHSRQINAKMLGLTLLGLGLASALSYTLLFFVLLLGPATVVCLLLARLFSGSVAHGH